MMIKNQIFKFRELARFSCSSAFKSDCGEEQKKQSMRKNTRATLAGRLAKVGFQRGDIADEFGWVRRIS
jgi:hypothetical protein